MGELMKNIDRGLLMSHLQRFLLVLFFDQGLRPVVLIFALREMFLYKGNPEQAFQPKAF
jgi:hypothetical protein